MNKNARVRNGRKSDGRGEISLASRLREHTCAFGAVGGVDAKGCRRKVGARSIMHYRLEADSR